LTLEQFDHWCGEIERGLEEMQAQVVAWRIQASVIRDMERANAQSKQPQQREHG